MCGGREKLHILHQSEKTCICLSDRYKFSPALHRQHIYYLVSIRFKYCHVFQGKFFKGGELETNVQVISLLKLLTSKKLKDNPVSSDIPV